MSTFAGESWSLFLAHIAVPAYLWKNRTLASTHVCSAVWCNQQEQQTRRTSAKQQKAKYSLLGDSDHGHNSICGWTRALQWGQMMIDAHSHLQYSSLCIHNLPDRDSQSQKSKYTVISLTLTIKLFCLTNLDETANSFGFFGVYDSLCPPRKRTVIKMIICCVRWKCNASFFGTLLSKRMKKGSGRVASILKYLKPCNKLYLAMNSARQTTEQCFLINPNKATHLPLVLRLELRHNP